MIGRRLSPAMRAQATAHVKRVASRNAIVVTFSETYRSRSDLHEPFGTADVESRRTGGPPIQTALDYFLHLHEIGHVIVGNIKAEVTEEGKAWAWAAKTADPKIMATMTETAWNAVGRWFVSYVQYEATRPQRYRNSR